MTKRRAEEDAVFWDAGGTTSTNNFKKKSCCGSSASFCGVDAQLDGMARMLDPPSLLLAVLGSRCRKRLNDNDDDGDNTPEQHEGPARQRRKTPSRADNCSVLQKQHTCASFPGGVLHSSTTTSDHHNKRLRPDDDDDDDDEVSPRTTKSRNDGVGDADGTRDLCTFNSFQYWRVPLPEIDQSLFDDMNSQSEPRAKPKDKNCSPPDAMET